MFLSKNDPIFISTISSFFCYKLFRAKTYWSASCYKLYNAKNVLLDDKPTFLRGSDIFKSQIVSSAFRRIDWGFGDFISSLFSGLSFANNGDCLSWIIFFFNYNVLSVWHSFKTFLKIDKLVTSSELFDELNVVVIFFSLDFPPGTPPSDSREWIFSFNFLIYSSRSFFLVFCACSYSSIILFVS